MSLPSFYGTPGGDEEKELFYIAPPDELPTSPDKTIAVEEDAHLASPDYDDRQAQADEDVEANRQENSGQLAGELMGLITELSIENLDVLMQMAREMLDKQCASE
jgi:hypothetical protein